MQLALILFIAIYILLLIFSKLRAYIALGGAVLFVVLGILPARDVLASIDFNVLLMIAGTMGTVTLFIESKMPSLLSDIIIEKTPNVKWAVVALALFAGIISAFVDNVATVLMVAPVALVVARRMGISPVMPIIAIAVSSNLQGAATLVGDTTSILLGGHARMDFVDFFVFQGRPGIFWAVEIGAILSAAVLLFLFRRENKTVSVLARTRVEDYFPTLLLVGTVVLLIAASFIPEKPAITNGVICVGLMLVGMLRNAVKTHSLRGCVRVLKEIDYFTLLLLASLFVIIAGITEAGVVDALAQLFVQVGGDNLFLIYTLIVWASVVFSAFIDNIPYVATMLPVVAGIANLMAVEPYVLYFGLLVGATLGGNLTPIGASANITALGILRKEGYAPRTGEFMKIGVPFTLAAVISGYLLVWLVWA